MRQTSTSGILRAVILALCAATAASAQMGGGMGHHGNGNGNENSNMGRGMGGVMLTSGGTPYRSDRTLVRMDDAQAIAERYLTSLAASGLALDEIEEWDYNFYVVVKETAPPEYKAFQLLIDKWTGAVMPEPGPNMMWNQKYRMRGGMGHLGQPGQGTQPMPITAGEANAAAMQFLRERFPTYPNAEVTTIDTFYGYYNVDVTDSATGVKLGMLSVNGQTGQVWYHTWHGAFIQGREIP